VLGIVRLRGAAVIYTFHNTLPKNTVARWKLRLYFGILRKRVDGVIAPMSSQIRHARTLFPKARTTHIPLGLPSLSRAGTDPRRAVDTIAPTLAGRAFAFVPGIQESTRKTECAVAELRSRRPDLAVLICGHFPKSAYLSFLRAAFAEDPEVVIKERFLGEDALCNLCHAAEAVIASQVNGANSGIALMSVALGVPCFCATAKTALSVRRDYGTTLVWPLDCIDQPEVWERVRAARGASANPSLAIPEMAKRMLAFIEDSAKA